MLHSQRETDAWIGWLRYEVTDWFSTELRIGNKLVPLDTEQLPQAPLIESTDFLVIFLGDCPTFRAIQEDW